MKIFLNNPASLSMMLKLQAYRFVPTDNLLEKLLALNLDLAAKEQRGEPVIGPWDPTQSN